MSIAFYMVLTLAAMNDIIALKFHISLNATTCIDVVRHRLRRHLLPQWLTALRTSARLLLALPLPVGRDVLAVSAVAGVAEDA